MSQPARKPLPELVHAIVDVTPPDPVRSNTFACHVEVAILRSRLESTGHSFSDVNVSDRPGRAAEAL